MLVFTKENDPAWNYLIYEFTLNDLLSISLIIYEIYNNYGNQ